MNIELNSVQMMKKPKIDISKKQKKEAIVALIMIVVAIGGTFAFLGILRVSLKTDNPLVVVISESMLPTIEKGDLLIIQGKDPAEIEIGAIILYDSLGLWPDQIVPEPIVHRVVNRTYNATEETYYFYTLGDNNDGNIDPPDQFNVSIIPVPDDRVIGVVKLIIPKIGKIKMWMDDTEGLSTIILVGLSIALLISIVWDLTHPEEEDEDKKIEKEKELEDKANINPKDNSEIDLGI